MGYSVLAHLKRKRLRAPGLLIALVLAALIASTVLASPAQAVSYSSEEIAFVQMLNDYRASNGLGALLVSDAASLACDRHNADMGKYGFFSHTTSGSDWFAVGALPWDRMAACGYDYNTAMGENIAAGYASASAVFAGWKSSSGHNANMLSPKYNVVGVSLVQVSGSRYGSYWTTDFGGYVDPSSHGLGSEPTTTAAPTTTTTRPPTTTAYVPPTTTTTTTTVYVPPTTTTTTSTTRRVTTTTVRVTTTTARPPTTTTVRPTTTTTMRPTTTKVKPAATFSDVGGNTLYAQQIWYLADRGVISGFSNGTFGPNHKVTRQQFTKMIVLALGYEVPPIKACGFKDVAALPGSADPLYPISYIAACAKAGITVGTTANTFSPYDQITRAQLITMVVRAAGLSDPPAGYRPPFDYFSPAHYQWARKAAYAGLLDGLAGLGPGFDFWAAASRGEVCLLLANLMRR